MSVPVTRLGASAYRIPTDAPEADGTLQWDATTLVLVEVEAGGRTGLGFTYTDASAAALVATTLAKAVDGADALSPPAAWAKLRHAVRNIGRNGMVAMAISAVDAALWDLKARLHDLTLATLLGPVRDTAIAHRRCTCTPLARRHACATSNGSTTTCASRRCCSTARRSRKRA